MTDTSSGQFFNGLLDWGAQFFATISVLDLIVTCSPYLGHMNSYLGHQLLSYLSARA